MDHFGLCMIAHSHASYVHPCCPIWFPLSPAFLFLPFFWGLDYLWVNNKRKEVWWVFGTHMCAFGVANPNVIEFSFFVLSFDFGPPTLMWVSIPFHFLVCYFILLLCFGFQFNSCVFIVFIYLLFTNLFCLWNRQKITKRESSNKCKLLFRIALWYELVNACMFSWIYV